MRFAIRRADTQTGANSGLTSFLLLALVLGCHPAVGVPRGGQDAAVAEICSDTTSTPLPPPTPPAGPLRPGEYRRPENPLTPLSRELPGGFGGAYVEPARATRVPVSGRKNASAMQWVLRLQDSTISPANRAALIARLGNYYHEEIDSARVRFQPSRWNLAQLEDWHRSLLGSLFREAGVHMSGIDMKRNRLSYTVVSDSVRRSARAFFAQRGVPCGLIDLHVGPMAQALQRTEAAR